MKVKEAIKYILDNPDRTVTYMDGRKEKCAYVIIDEEGIFFQYGDERGGGEVKSFPDVEYAIGCQLPLLKVCGNCEHYGKATRCYCDNICGIRGIAGRNDYCSRWEAKEYEL